METKRGIGMIFFRADNCAVAEHPLVKLRASIVRESRHFPDE